MKIRLEAISRFAWSMATCLRSGLPLRKALELSGATGTSGGLGSVACDAADAIDRGMTLADGLEQNDRLLPHFVVPITRAGELSGRLVEAFQLIHEHCERLKPTLDIVRKTWLYPLVCILAGWIIRAALFLYFGLYSFAWQFVRDTFLTWGALVLVAWALLRLRWVNALVDWLLAQLPLVRETLIRLSVVLFFTTFRLGYEAGGLAVTAVCRLALATIRNSVIRDDFAKALPVLEAHGTFEEAFSQPALLDDNIKSSITAGALSGQLGTTLGQVVRTETSALEIALEQFNRIFHRVVGFVVAMSVVGTLLMCLFYRPGA